ncbi:MAG: type 1 glutamine amidotransferase [Kineosporiaceae bacterium]
MTRTALLIEHDAYTRPGLVGEALERRGFHVERRLVVPEARFHSPDVEYDFPDPRAWDLIVPMGAPWSVDDRAAIGSWIVPELQMLATAHAEGVPVLGLCFGGQAMSVALGGSVERASGWEIGWGAIETDEPELVGPGPWFQFHQDAMVLPPGAREVARNAVCPQAWTARRTLAVQFHPELTAEVLGLWMDNGGREVVTGQGLDADRLVEETMDTQDQAGLRAATLVDAFLDRIARY